MLHTYAEIFTVNAYVYILYPPWSAVLVVSIASLAETHSKREMIWLYGVRPIRKSGPPKTMFSRSLWKGKKNTMLHTQPEPGLSGGQSIKIPYIILSLSEVSYSN